MPGQTTPDWIANPLAIVDKLFGDDTSAYENDAAALRTAVEAAFQARIKTGKSDYRYLVPLINGLSKQQLRTIPSNSLVRLRCMIQDERSSNYHQPFLVVRQKDSLEVKVVCAMFKDGVALEPNEEVVGLGEPGSLVEMRSLKCVPLPAETQWSRQISSELGNVGISASAKINTDAALPVFVANFFAEAGASIGINDALEVFGVLGFEDEAPAGASEPVVSPTSSEEIRLNSFFHEVLTHSHPALPLEKQALLSLAGEDALSFPEIRIVLKDALTSCLSGDQVAAEYLLLHLISSVYARVDGQAFGNFPLNLTNMPQEVTFVKRLTSTLENFLTSILSFPMSIASLNDAQMAPKMTQGTAEMEHKLAPGFLQLPKHTYLVLDEVGMDTGRLNDAGCRNLLALQKLVHEQKLDFDFLFGQVVPFLMDIPVLVLSQGKSLVNCRCVIPVIASGAVEEVFLSEEAVWQIRQYLVTAKFLDYEISNEMREAIVDDFVKARKIDGSISPDLLHQKLELARYMTISYGEGALTKEKWEQVLKLEGERCRRLKEGSIH